MNYIRTLHTLREQIQQDGALDEEEIVLLSHYAGLLHSDVLERVQDGLSAKRKVTYTKRPKTAEACACGGKQKPVYLVDDKRVCQRCYIRRKK